VTRPIWRPAAAARRISSAVAEITSSVSPGSAWIQNCSWLATFSRKIASRLVAGSYSFVWSAPRRADAFQWISFVGSPGTCARTPRKRSGSGSSPRRVAVSESGRSDGRCRSATDSRTGYATTGSRSAAVRSSWMKPSQSPLRTVTGPST